MDKIDYTNEIWKPIPFALTYAVSNFGRVKRLVKGPRGIPPGHILATSNWSPNRDYVCAHIVTNDGEVVTRRMNRLVLEVFVGPPPSKSHVSAHSDGNSLNNRLENLRWATPKENMDDARRHGTLPNGSDYKHAKLTEEAVREIRASSDLQKNLAAKFGVRASTISRVKNRVDWKHI